MVPLPDPDTAPLEQTQHGKACPGLGAVIHSKLEQMHGRGLSRKEVGTAGEVRGRGGGKSTK